MKTRLLSVGLAAGALVSTPGCLLLLASAEPSCPGEGLDTTGDLMVGDAAFAATVDTLSLDFDPDGQCITALYASIDLGQGCSLSFEADGSGDALAIFGANLWGGEGCGLEGSPSVQDDAESEVDVDGSLSSFGRSRSSCWSGTLTMSIDLELEDDGETTPLAGEILVDGVEIAYPENGSCG